MLVYVQGSRYLWCQRFCVLRHGICTPSLFSPTPHCGAISKPKQAMNLWHHKYLDPCLYKVFNFPNIQYFMIARFSISRFYWRLILIFDWPVRQYYSCPPARARKVLKSGILPLNTATKLIWTSDPIALYWFKDVKNILLTQAVPLAVTLEVLLDAVSAVALEAVGGALARLSVHLVAAICAVVVVAIPVHCKRGGYKIQGNVKNRG